jgi:hypothetical protein
MISILHKKEQFDHIISLGESCQVAHQIRRYFHIQGAHFFDWIYVTLPSLIKLIENEFEDVCLRENLGPSNSKRLVRDSKYNICYFHEFKPENGQLLPNYLDHYAEAKEKYDYLIKKFLLVLNSSERCLFIQRRAQWIDLGNYSDPGLAAEFEKILEQKAPKLDFKILYIDLFKSDKLENCSSRSISIHMNQRIWARDHQYYKMLKENPTLKWMGSRAAWDAVLKKYKLTDQHKEPLSH